MISLSSYERIKKELQLRKYLRKGHFVRFFLSTNKRIDQTMAKKSSNNGNKGAKSGSKSSNGVGKQSGKQSKHKVKALGKATRSKISKLNQDLEEIESVRASLNLIGKQKKPITALDANDLKAGLLRDTEEKKKNTEAKKELEKQLDLMGGLGL